MHPPPGTRTSPSTMTISMHFLVDLNQIHALHHGAGNVDPRSPATAYSSAKLLSGSGSLTLSSQDWRSAVQGPMSVCVVRAVAMLVRPPVGDCDDAPGWPPAAMMLTMAQSQWRQDTCPHQPRHAAPPTPPVNLRGHPLGVARPARAGVRVRPLQPPPWFQFPPFN